MCLPVEMRVSKGSFAGATFEFMVDFPKAYPIEPPVIWGRSEAKHPIIKENIVILEAL